MTKKAQLAIELSTKRQRVNELLGLPDGELTTEQRSEMDGLTVRLQEIEPELRAAIVAEETAQTVSTGEGTAEEREMRAMVDRASVGAIFAAVVEHRATEGPEASYRSHLGLRRIRSRWECWSSIGPSPQHRQTWEPPRARSSLAFSRRAQALSWAWIMPTVAVGDASFDPGFTTNASVHAPDEGAEAAETTRSFNAVMH